jgi:hypothetical protein
MYEKRLRDAIRTNLSSRTRGPFVASSMSKLHTLSVTTVLFLTPVVASAQTSAPSSGPSDEPSQPTSSAARDEPRDETPIAAFAYTAHGGSMRNIGVQAYGLGLFATGQDGVLGGGGAVWGSPLDRLTLIVDGQRNLSREFSPSAAAIFRLHGDGREGMSIGLLGKFKIDGFAAGPSHDEVESEIELGALVSYRRYGWSIDANAIAGAGTGDEGETDAEGRLRLGRALGSHWRVGLDGQLRARVGGPRYLPNGRTWDFAAGPQVAATFNQWYGSLTAGPATTGLVSNDVGWIAVLSLGGTAR